MFRFVLRPCSVALAVGVLTWIGPSVAQTPKPEVRGTWLTTTGPDHISSGTNTAAIVGQLRDIGVNTLYTEAWKSGTTQFASPTLQNLIGVDRTPSLGSRDLLNEVVIQAHRNNQAAIAWFEYGFATEFVGNGGTPFNALSSKARDNGWLLQDPSGNYANASNGFAWMNPAIPEVRQFLIGITLDAVRSHDLDGVQFDDRLAWPKEFGWDATTAALYKAETNRNLPTSTSDANFRAWRQSKVTLFAQELSAAVRAENPTLQLSISPSVTGFSDNNYNAKWSDWVAQGLFDEYVPQVYRDNLGDFRASLTDNVAVLKANGALDQLVVGLRLNGTGADTPLSVLQQQIVDAALAEQGRLAGHAVFYSKGLIANASSMQGFYGNQRDSPFFDADRRPDPLVASRTGLGDAWEVVVDEALAYRVVAEVGGRWKELDSRYFGLGTFTLNVANATQVELLVDRRLTAEVPEPATAALLLVGAAVVVRRPRRRAPSA